mgnify:CR=1 FL=1
METSEHEAADGGVETVGIGHGTDQGGGQLIVRCAAGQLAQRTQGILTATIRQGILLLGSSSNCSKLEVDEGTDLEMVCTVPVPELSRAGGGAEGWDAAAALIK